MEPTPAKGMWVPLAVITNIEKGESHIDTKEYEEGDIWCEAVDPHPIHRIGATHF